MMQNATQTIEAPIKPPKLLEQVVAKMRIKHYSIRAEKTYVDWIKRYIWHHEKRHLNEMGKAEVEAFLIHLAAENNEMLSSRGNFAFKFASVVKEKTIHLPPI